MQGLTNVSMMYLNYPAKVLFKSSRMVPIMCFGVVWQVRTHDWPSLEVACRVALLLPVELPYASKYRFFHKRGSRSIPRQRAQN